MDIDGYEQIAARARRRARGLSGARRLRWPGLGAALTLASGCGIRAMLERLDEDKDGVMLGEDCDEQDAAIGNVPLYVDQDGDGHGVPPQVTVGCEGEAGLSTLADDCDDDNLHIWQEATWYLDNDRDGYGVEPGVRLCASEAAGYALEAGDCLDDDPGAWPGAPTSCDGDDNDCDGQVDPDCELPSGALSGSDADWLLLGTEDAQLGAALAPAGDVDCDGLEDLLVGAPGAGAGEGAVVLAYGAEAGLSWTLGEEREGVAVLTGAKAGGGFGLSVAGSADFDSDGCADLLLGSPWEGDGGVGEVSLGGGWGGPSTDGALYVVTGPWLPSSAEIDDLLSGGVLVGDAGERLGSSLSCGADHLGDGSADCVAGAPFGASAEGEEQGGAVRLFAPPLLGGGGASEAASLTVSGSALAERLGGALGSGDLDADGVDDLMIGAATDFSRGAWSEHATRVGRIYLVLDVPSGDYAADGLADAWIEGEAADGTGLAIASEGDLDADGYADLAVGAPSFVDEAGAGTVGRALVLSGDALRAQRGAVTDLEALALTLALGAQDGDQLGASVALIADLSGDDRDELLVGAPGTDGTRGEALLFLDSTSGVSSSEAAQLRVTGSGAGDRFGQQVAAAGDPNGLGLADLLIGGSAAIGEDGLSGGPGVALLVFMDAY